MESNKYTLNKANLEQAALYVIYAMVGAGFAALLQEATKFNFGQFTVVVTGVCSVASMLFHMWATGPRAEANTVETAVETSVIEGTATTGGQPVTVVTQ